MMSMSDDDLANLIIETVQTCDGFRYVRRYNREPTHASDVSFSAYCSRSQSHQNQVSVADRQRVCRRMPAFDCHGRILGKIKRAVGYVDLRIYHIDHERVDDTTRDQLETQRNLVPMDIRDYIAENAENMDAAALYRLIIRDFNDPDVTKMQVYYWWTRTFRSRYCLDEADQMRSSRLVLEQYNDQGFAQVSEMQMSLTVISSLR